MAIMFLFGDYIIIDFILEDYLTTAHAMRYYKSMKGKGTKATRKQPGEQSIIAIPRKSPTSTATNSFKGNKTMKSESLMKDNFPFLVIDRSNPSNDVPIARFVSLQAAKDYAKSLHESYDFVQVVEVEMTYKTKQVYPGSNQSQEFKTELQNLDQW